MNPVVSDRSPLANPAFRKLFSAQLIALVGTALSTMALSLLAIDLVGPKEALIVLGFALAAKMVAYVVFAPIVGGIAHRFPRKSLLITLDIVRAGIVLLMPFVTAVWQIYLLIFLLNLFSAGFKPVFSATIPDILPDEREYTKALAYSRLAYDLESVLSPVVAGIALLYLSYSELFQINSAAFVVSALLILITALPAQEKKERIGGVWAEISFGVISYMKTPRLRALLTLYLAVASASSIVIILTPIYVLDNLGGTETQYTFAIGAAGFGSMIMALSMTAILDRVSDRLVMLSGALFMGAGVLSITTSPSLLAMMPIWLVIGMGLSMVQTPAGRIVNRSASPSDRAAYFSAQFALSHGAWLIMYLVAGQLGARIGIEATAMWMGAGILVFGGFAYLVWPREDRAEIEHRHHSLDHGHLHSHGPHHQHAHRGDEGPEPHSHPHYHPALKHAHDFFIDEHHIRWPKPG